MKRAWHKLLCKIGLHRHRWNMIVYLDHGTLQNKLIRYIDCTRCGKYIAEFRDDIGFVMAEQTRNQEKRPPTKDEMFIDEE